MIESRIKEIEEFLTNVQIIEEVKGSSEVRYGSKVTIEKDGHKFTLTIVGSGEVDILNDTISFESPLGMALKGKKKGIYKGKVAVRSSGSFNIKVKQGRIEGIGWKNCIMLHRFDGYSYTY